MRPIQVAQTLESNKWKFASTFKYRAPHWYTLIETWDDKDHFTRIAHSVREYSSREYFWGKPFLVWNYKGMKYWVMDDDPKDAVIINKTFNSSQYKGRDDIELKDTGELNPQVTRRILTDIIDQVLQGRFVYEIGCGQTTNINMCHFVCNADYLGVDPVSFYVQLSRQKNPGYKFLVDRFETYRRGKFIKERTVLVGLYGSPNFVLGEYLAEVAEYGGYILMFYKKDKCPHSGIYPIYYTSEEIDVVLGVKSKTIETENYIIKYKV